MTTAMVERYEAINLCNNALVSIGKLRHERKQYWIAQDYKWHLTKWKYFTKWLGFSKPTRQDSEERYANPDDCMSAAVETSLYLYRAENRCKEILTAMHLSKSEEIAIDASTLHELQSVLELPLTHAQFAR
jgi:hypothetical protein